MEYNEYADLEQGDIQALPAGRSACGPASGRGRGAAGACGAFLADIGLSALRFDGAVNRPRDFSRADLERLPARHVDIAYQTGSGDAKAAYTGVLLWTLLGEAGGLNDPGRRADLRHTIAVTGRDGYTVVLSLGELDPDFGSVPAIVAFRRDDRTSEPLRDFRLVVPGDRHGGRNVRDVVHIEVK